MEEAGLLSEFLATGQGFGYLTQRFSLENPDKEAVICGKKRRTYKELEAHICGLANSLQQMGIGRGTRVGLILPNCVEYLEIEFACARLGAVLVKLSWRLAGPELEKLAAFNEVDLIFYQQEMAKEHGWEPYLAKTGAPLIDAGGLRYQEMLKQGKGDFLPEPAIPGSELMHLHTSGTTGTPKCVIYTQESLLAELDTCREALGFTRDTVFQVMSQLFHAACVGPYTCLSLGGTLILFPRFQPKEYLASIEGEKVTHLSAIPTVLRAMLDCPDFDSYCLSSLKTVYYSTCPIPPGLIEEAKEKIGCQFFQSYGMTEMGSIVTVLKPEEHFSGGGRYRNSVGKPVKGGAVKIVDENGKEMAAGQTGEICLKGPGMMRGYYHMERETSCAIRDGWYVTGDMGYLDEQGYLFLTGRKSDMIISGGENIYPKEIEDVLYCHPDVREAAVYGVADAYWGESVHACVVLRAGALLEPEQLRMYCRGRLAGYKIPKKIWILPGLPKNSTGKVRKKELPALEPEFEKGGYL